MWSDYGKSYGEAVTFKKAEGIKKQGNILSGIVCPTNEQQSQH